MFFDRHENKIHGHLSARAVPDNEFVNGSRSQHLIIEASIYFLPGFSSLLAFKDKARVKKQTLLFIVV